MKEAEVMAELEPPPDDYQIEKRNYSAFFETDLEKLLRTLKYGARIACAEELIKEWKDA